MGFIDHTASAVIDGPTRSLSPIKKIQEHVVVADADTGRSYIADWSDTKPHDARTSYLVAKITNDNSMVYFEYTTGRISQEDIQIAVSGKGLSSKQVGLLAFAYRERYGEELKVTARPPVGGGGTPLPEPSGQN